LRFPAAGHDDGLDHSTNGGSMALAERRASVVWTGDAAQGSGTVTLDSSGLGGELPMSLPTRTGEAEGGTTPEELIAGAHAGCYAMALSNYLAGQGNPAGAARGERGRHARAGRRGTRGDPQRPDRSRPGPGLDEDEFVQAAREGERACPVSNALRGNVEIGLDASLAG
jgi:osmotically inducible protein OsmC